MADGEKKWRGKQPMCCDACDAMQSEQRVTLECIREQTNVVAHIGWTSESQSRSVVFLPPRLLDAMRDPARCHSNPKGYECHWQFDD